MDESNGEFRFIVPFKPTLFHISLSKVATGLHKEFNYEILKNVLSNMELKSLPEDHLILHNRVKEKLLLIPTNLRKNVLEAIKRVKTEISQWRHDHRRIHELDDTKLPFIWRCDGTIDRTKTAQEIIRNQNIDVRYRFDLACIYCLVDSVQTLWKELKEYADAEDYQASFNGIEHFWVKWMREGTHVPWFEAARGCAEPFWILHPMGSVPRFSTIFREIQPRDRRKYFRYLYFSDSDDLRFCLYTVTKTEQEEIMSLFADRVLRIYMKWPLESLFLETADKAWKFLTNSSFCELLGELLECKNEPGLDYAQLAIEFWNKSPSHLKEVAKENECLKNKLERIQEGLKKRKIAHADQASSKKIKN